MRKYRREFNVYKIVNDVDDKVYVGSTTTELWHRFSQHKADALKGCSSPLYDLMRQYGTKHFQIVRVKTSDAENIRTDEEQTILSVPVQKRLNYKLRCANDVSSHYDYDEIVRVYTRVQSQNQTANIIGCSRITVTKALRSQNIDIVYPPHTAYKYRTESI